MWYIIQYDYDHQMMSKKWIADLMFHRYSWCFSMEWMLGPWKLVDPKPKREKTFEKSQHFGTWICLITRNLQFQKSIFRFNFLVFRLLYSCVWCNVLFFFWILKPNQFFVPMSQPMLSFSNWLPRWLMPVEMCQCTNDAPWRELFELCSSTVGMDSEMILSRSEDRYGQRDRGRFDHSELSCHLLSKLHKSAFDFRKSRYDDLIVPLLEFSVVCIQLSYHLFLWFPYPFWLCNYRTCFFVQRW